MGGFGSGRPAGRCKVEACRSIDVNRLHREGCLRAGSWASRQWSRDGDKRSLPDQYACRTRSAASSPIARAHRRRRVGGRQRDRPHRPHALPLLPNSTPGCPANRPKPAPSPAASPNGSTAIGSGFAGRSLLSAAGGPSTRTPRCCRSEPRPPATLGCIRNAGRLGPPPDTPRPSLP